MGKTIWAVAFLAVMGVLAGCATARTTEKQALSKADVPDWKEEHSAKTEALDEEMQRFVPQAQAALLEQFPSRYVYSDRAQELKELVSNCIVVGSPSELMRVAQDAHKEIGYVELTTFGQAKVRGRKGVVVGYSGEWIDAEWEAWVALPPAEKKAKPAPEHFDKGGTSFRAFITRKGRKAFILKGVETTYDPLPLPPVKR